MAAGEADSTLSDDITGDVVFYVPNFDVEGSVALHQLVVQHEGEEFLVAEVTDGEPGSEVVAAYRGRSGFRTVATAPDTFENAQVFVIVDHSTSSFRGQRLRVDALVTDSAGEHRCGSLIFRAGSE